jgi:indole-3-glycerol phosphate synthase
MMNDVLSSIIEGVREDERNRRLSRAELTERLTAAPAPCDALNSLRSRSFSVIAEVKRSSPSKGDLARIASPESLAQRYADNGAAVVSVLTEQRRFKGSLADFQAVRERVSIPILRKDFMVSEYLIEESRAYGADLILLIVAALDDSQLRDFYQLATSLGMRSLIEIHDEAELERAMRIEPEIIGVNSRNLKTLEVGAATFQRLIPKIPGEIYRVAESGISGPSDAKFARSFGADAILVGESLVRASDPGKALEQLLSVTD